MSLLLGEQGEQCVTWMMVSPEERYPKREVLLWNDNETEGFAWKCKSASSLAQLVKALPQYRRVIGSPSWVPPHGIPFKSIFPSLSEAPGKLGNVWNLIFLTWRTVSKRCSFGGRNHWFRMDGMPIRVKKMRFKKYPDSSGPGPNLHVAYITENDLSRVLNLIYVTSS